MVMLMKANGISQIEYSLNKMYEITLIEFYFTSSCCIIFL